MERFDFGEAVSMLKIGETVCLELDGKIRNYHMENEQIMCAIEGSHVTYSVQKFYTDAILSENWYLYDK